MLNREILQQLFEAVAMKDKPLTIVAAGNYPREVVDSFVEKCRTTGKKANNDCAQTFCHGNAAHRRCNWTAEFRRMACEHFLLKDFDSAFTSEGKRSQAVAKELHRHAAKKTNLAKSAGKAAQDLAKALNLVAKKAELHGAKIVMVDDLAFRVEITATVKGTTDTHVFTVDASGIQPLLGEKSEPEFA